MSDTFALYDPAVGISRVPPSYSTTPEEREVRRLLSLNTPTDTAAARQKLRDMESSPRQAEWYFLMGVCALRQGYIADAQAHLDRACMLGVADAAREYRTLYESARSILEKRVRNRENKGPGESSCFSGLDCFDCLYCCDCHDSGSCCDCSDSDGCCDGCDCSDGCN